MDISESIDPEVLDRTVDTFHNGHGSEQRSCQDILNTIINHPDAWMRVPYIIRNTQQIFTKYFALQILEPTIKKRWRSLSKAECTDIKSFVINMLTYTASSEELFISDKLLLGKLNTLLVEIVKREPHSWSNFISEQCSSFSINDTMCQNGLALLQILSDEIFHFCEMQMTGAKAGNLQALMRSGSSEILGIVVHVLDTSASIAIVEQALDTLQSCIKWISVTVLSKSDLVAHLTYQLLLSPPFRARILRCLSEIANLIHLQEFDNGIDCWFETAFIETINAMKSVFPPDVDLRSEYNTGSDNEKELIAALALFLSACLCKTDDYLEDIAEDSLEMAMDYLLKLAQVQNADIVTLSLEYWSYFLLDLYTNYTDETVDSPDTKQLSSLRIARFIPMIHRLRNIIIANMVSPDNTYVAEDNQGAMQSRAKPETEASQMYMLMKKVIAYIQLVDEKETMDSLLLNLDIQSLDDDSVIKQTRVCWVICCLQVCTEEKKQFLIDVISKLEYTWKNSSDQHRVAVTANLLYVAGHYCLYYKHRDIKCLEDMLGLIVRTMHDENDSLKDIACDAFLKFSEKSCHIFSNKTHDSQYPAVVHEIITNIELVICNLQEHQIMTVFQALGYMVVLLADENNLDTTFETLMFMPNQRWSQALALVYVSEAINVWGDLTLVKELSHLLKINATVCKAMECLFAPQMKQIYSSLLDVYQAMSANIIQALSYNGELAVNQPLIKYMRCIRQQVLQLFSEYLRKYESHEQLPNEDLIVTPLLGQIILDYKESPIASAREPEVLSLLVTLMKTINANMTFRLPNIFIGIFHCTADMINKNFDDFPEHRMKLFIFTRDAIDECFEGIKQFHPESFHLMFQTITWAMRHPDRDICAINVHTHHLLLQKIFSTEESTQAYGTRTDFARAHFCNCMENMFNLLTDSSFSANFLGVCKNITYLFRIALEPNLLREPIYTEGRGVGSNWDYVRSLVENQLISAYPHLSVEMINVTMNGIEYSRDLPLNDILRDFLVDVREHIGDDDRNDDLYLEEREEVIKQKKVENELEMAMMKMKIKTEEK